MKCLFPQAYAHVVDDEGNRGPEQFVSAGEVLEVSEAEAKFLTTTPMVIARITWAREDAPVATPGFDPIKVDEPKAEAPPADAPPAEAPQADAPKAEAPKAEAKNAKGK